MTVSVLLVRALVDCVESAGVSRQKLFDEGDFDGARLDDADGRLSGVEYDRLIDVAVELSGDPALGLHMGELASTTQHSVVGHLVGHAPTMRHAIESLLRYHPLLAEKTSLEFLEEGDSAIMRHVPGSGPSRCERFRAEMAMVGFYRMVWFFSQGEGAKRVLFAHPRPDYGAEYDRIFAGGVTFGADETAVRFGRDVLSRPQLHADSEFFEILRAQAERRIGRLMRTESHADRVRAVLVERASGAQDMDTVARALGMSVRSLRRRLREEGIAFGSLVDEARTLLAKQYLSEDHRSIEDTAYALGFSDPSAFHRAFKRWTGTTPSEFRRVRRV
ncbi:MAG TPA: AraC family transcriptional regulator [Polyangiaceae bacterium]|nr:AraC family transcriptional regulator [Polyangiaceae bacterium]